ncbi:DNA repair protein RadA [Chthonomonas calidirosea]|uniref:DNA repair protein RadA n=1 Tax=Chthonomonas calidirosea TaxID=454171 RepID=UPI0006DD495D|nr:DNA repair protein RadA [Chthonomonas calidirosea]CEK20523.1 DNA repair protein RadA [Chthonomonas calidirosea]
MSQFQTRYVCQNCGYESLKWLGRCPECETWDSFVEEVVLRPSHKARSGAKSSQAISSAAEAGAPLPITQVEMASQPRLLSGIGEFDRVLGGGVVPGSIVLVGGDPGIGKSTLLTQVAYRVATGQEAGSVLYISGEESAQQIRLRSARLGAETERFFVSVETDIERIEGHLDKLRPILAIVDSIQTTQDGALDSIPGSVSQVRACASRLARFSKATGIPIILIGHVTKEGNLAGPRVLEHIVDTVLYFEGDRQNAYRLLRAVKNRFGSTDELGIFEMREQGLVSVDNPSAALLAERTKDGIGSVITATLEGTRALLVEVQGLAARSFLASPRRVINGLDPNRVNMILAVLEKRLGLKLAEQDVFVNVAGGVHVVETAADLAVAMAVISSFREQPVEPTTVFIGEVGLNGEIRAVSQSEKRLREAARQGFQKALIAKHNLAELNGRVPLEVIGISSIVEALPVGLLKTSV